MLSPLPSSLHYLSLSSITLFASFVHNSLTIPKPPSIFFVSLLSVSMLGDSEKMVVIPPTNNEWPQIGDQKISSMGSGGRTTRMEKLSGQELQQQQLSLKCPRCDSTNTKFCYYNNYSLSQPRHFCKSCKRYWTRGGTLRNVPVGGGCRKNKRVKRQIPASDHTPSSSSSPPSAANSNLPSQPNLDNHVSPLFYGLPGGNSNSDMNLPFPRFNSGYDHFHQPHLSALGLGFSSGYTSNDSLFLNYNSIFGNSIFGGSSTSISSLLSPSTNLQQQKFINGGMKDDVPGTNNFQGLDPLEEMKVDEERPNQIIEHGSLFDYYPPYYWNDKTNNVGPSVTSMIE